MNGFNGLFLPANKNAVWGGTIQMRVGEGGRMRQGETGTDKGGEEKRWLLSREG